MIIFLPSGVVITFGPPAVVEIEDPAGTEIEFVAAPIETPLEEEDPFEGCSM